LQVFFLPLIAQVDLSPFIAQVVLPAFEYLSQFPSFLSQTGSILVNKGNYTTMTTLRIKNLRNSHIFV
jgi:hypothetical protein